MIPLLQIGQLGVCVAQEFPSIEAFSTTSYVNAVTSQSQNVPSSAQAGDLLIVMVMHRSAINSVPAGWSLAASNNVVAGGFTHYLSAYSKTCVAGDVGASVSFGQTSSGRMGMQILVCRNGQGLPQSVKSSNTSTATGAGSSTMPVASVSSSGSFIGIVAATFTIASTSPTTTTITTPYTQVSVASAVENRLGIGWTRLNVGDSVSGSVVTDSVNAAVGAVALSLAIGF
jgi:hypothetical protein